MQLEASKGSNYHNFQLSNGMINAPCSKKKTRENVYLLPGCMNTKNKSWWSDGIHVFFLKKTTHSKSQRI